MQKLAIGMFDSGVGGMTVFKEVKELLPHEHIIYFGDTARVPYGNKSPRMVTKYALESALFLLTKGIKLLIIACNTSSAFALQILQRRMPVPVIGVISPGATEAVRHTKSGRVGVIGTRTTIKSTAYERSIRKLNAGMEVFSRACPLFVPIVEEGLEHDEIARLMAEKYLGDLRETGIDVLVMGCTHYPVLEDVIRQTMGSGVEIVHSGKETAKEAFKILEERDLFNKRGRGKYEYFVTDSPESFREIGGRIVGEELTHVKSLKSLNYRDLLFSS
ncbi:MAG: glutamate racemase [Syntrophorhabdaceae bacterium]|nr:glutamate racemase [Syntrophorhabdaceae bacterium]